MILLHEKRFRMVSSSKKPDCKKVRYQWKICSLLSDFVTAFRDQRKKQIPPGMSTSKGKDEAATTKTKSPEVSKDESTSAKISRRSGRVANKSYVYSSSSLFSSKDSVSAEILSMPTIGQGVDLTSDDEFELEQIQDVDWQQI